MSHEIARSARLSPAQAPRRESFLRAGVSVAQRELLPGDSQQEYRNHLRDLDRVDAFEPFRDREVSKPCCCGRPLYPRCMSYDGGRHCWTCREKCACLRGQA